MERLTQVKGHALIFCHLCLLAVCLHCEACISDLPDVLWQSSAADILEGQGHMRHLVRSSHLGCFYNCLHSAEAAAIEGSIAKDASDVSEHVLTPELGVCRRGEHLP